MEFHAHYFSEEDAKSRAQLAAALSLQIWDNYRLGIPVVNKPIGDHKGSICFKFLVDGVLQLIKPPVIVDLINIGENLNEHEIEEEHPCHFGPEVHFFDLLVIVPHEATGLEADNTLLDVAKSLRNIVTLVAIIHIMDWIFDQTKNKTVRYVIKVLVIKFVKLYLANVKVDFTTANRWVMRKFFDLVRH